jgi:hypothetical protein
MKIYGKSRVRFTPHVVMPFFHLLQFVLLKKSVVRVLTVSAGT